MDGEVSVPTRKVPWKGLGAATAVAAIGAFVLNLGLGRVLVMGLPADEAAETPGARIAEAPATTEATPAGEPGGASPTGGEEATGAAVLGAIAPTATLSEADYRREILGRNLFDPTKIGVADAGACEGEDCEPVEEPKLEITAMLTGTVVSDMPSFSAAFIIEDGKTSSVAYGIGQELQGAELVEIQSDRVRLRRGADEQWLLLGQKSGTKATTTSSAAAPAEGAAGENGVTKNSETSYTISRATWDEKMADITSLTREARALLHRGPDGNYDGYRLSAIRRGSLADSLGIKNGDIIHDINGLALDSVDNAMKAFDTMRSDSNFKINVTRRGQPVALDYGIR